MGIMTVEESLVFSHRRGKRTTIYMDNNMVTSILYCTNKYFGINYHFPIQISFKQYTLRTW